MVWAVAPGGTGAGGLGANQGGTVCDGGGGGASCGSISGSRDRDEMLGEGGDGRRLVGTNSGARGFKMYVFFSSTSSSCALRSLHVVPYRLL